MIVERHDGARERRILIGVIVDPTVCGAVAARWNGERFLAPWSNLIAGWAVDYYRRYDKPPGRDIEAAFAAWAATGTKDEDTVKSIESLLGTLSGEYQREAEEINSSHLLDLAEEHFNRVRLKRAVDQISGFLDAGRLDKALEIYEETKDPVQVQMRSAIDLLNDKEAVQRAFDYRSEPVVEYPGPLGQFYGGTLERDGFVAYMGMEKIGKTWFLLDVAWRALLQRRRVAFFQLGDLSESQIIGRFLTRAAGHPMEGDEWPLVCKIPESVEKLEAKKEEGDFGYVPELAIATRDVTFHAPLEEHVGWAAFQKVQRERVKSTKPYFKLDNHSAGTLTVPSILATLRMWDRQGWSPDVVVIDYADILAPFPGYTESRDAVNANWMAMRAMSTQLRCLVVTATQVNSASYKAGLLDMTNFSEDKRKFSHVTAMVGLNQTDMEKEREVWRLNWLVRRGRKSSRRKVVYVAGCVGIGNPCVRSTF